jgi:hypothetical protein
MRYAGARTVLATAALIAVAATIVSVVHTSASAQPAWWPWSNSDRYERRERDPAWRPAPQQQPPPVVQQGPQYQGGQASRQNPICLQLEQRLVAESQRGAQSRDQLPRIEADLRQAERLARSSQAQLERADCYDYFLFSKTLRRTRQCVDLANQAEDAQRKLSEIDTQRQQMLGSRDRSYQDDIIRELARNNCGANYQQEAARRAPANPFSSLWQDEDTGPGGNSTQFGALPFATYRTVCVRLCDGYYFPVSFSTLPNHFSPTISSAMPTCANRNVRHRQNFTITKIRADRSSRWYLPRAISLTRASSRPSAIARNMSRAARANRLNIRRRPNARIAKQTPRHNQRRNRPSARVSRSILPSVAEKHLFAPFIVTNRLRSAGQIVY